MKKVLDVNLHRKIRRKNKIKRYFKIFLLFFIFFGIMFSVWQFSLKRIIFREDSENFPILFSGDAVLGFLKTKDGFCVLSNNQLNFYKKDGGVLRNIISSSPKKRIDGFEENILLYEKGAKNFSIQSEKKEIFSDVLENPIIFGKFFKNRGFIFATKSENYLCELVAFNNKNDQIFKWSCAEGLIVDFDLSYDSNSCIVTTIGTKDGFFKSFVYELNLLTGEEKLKKEFIKQTPIAIRKFGSIIVFVCESKIFFLDSNFNILNSIDCSKILKNFEFVDSGYFIASFSNLEKENFCDVIRTYDKFGNKIAECKTEEKVKKIKAFDSDIFMLTDEKIIHTNINLRNFKKVKNTGNIEEFIYDKPYLYFVSMNKLNRFLLK